MKRFVLLSLAMAAILAAGSSGIRSRADLSAYPAHESVEAAAFGAAIIGPEEVKKIFAADLNAAGYVVIEVGVFPASGREIDVSPLDFTLSTDPDSISERPADVDTIAAVAAATPRRGSSETSSSEISMTGGASVLHESYPDPVTGRRTGATIVAVNSGTEVSTSGSGQRLPPPASAGPNDDLLERQLLEKSLPDGKTTRAVAGYLYFPKPRKKGKSSWALRWESAAGRVNLVLPNPGK